MTDRGKTYHTRLYDPTLSPLLIEPGDVLAIVPCEQRHPRPGDRLLVNLPGAGLTARKWVPPYLESLNNRFPPVLYLPGVTSEADVRIVAVITGLYRRFDA